MKSWLTKQRYRDVNAIMDRVCLRELGYTYQDGTRAQSRGSVEILKQHSEALQAVENARREAQEAREAVKTAKAMESASMEHIAAETAKMERNRADLEGLRDEYAKAAIAERQEIIDLWEELESITGPQKLQLARDAKAYREIEQGLSLIPEDTAASIRETLATLRSWDVSLLRRLMTRGLLMTMILIWANKSRGLSPAFYLCREKLRFRVGLYNNLDTTALDLDELRYNVRGPCLTPLLRCQICKSHLA